MPSILYFGTDESSALVLKTLVNQGFTVVGVVTQPNRPVGRSQEFSPSPVKIAAEQLGLKVFQPATLKNFSPTKLPKADMFVVFAYGLLIPQEILNTPPHGTLNIHPSLLPKYRGPTPVQSAIINGDVETGVSVMLLDEEMDHGPILAQTKVSIAPDDTTQTLTEKLVTNAIPILLKTLPAWTDKKITATPQNHAQATYCNLLTRDDGRIDWNKTTGKIYNLYRGLTPWPGIWTEWEGKRLKLLSIRPCETPSSVLTLATPTYVWGSRSGGIGGGTSKLPSPFRGGAGGGVFIHDSHLFISCSQGAIEILKLQLEGKKPMDAKTFLQGYKHIDGAELK